MSTLVLGLGSGLEFATIGPVNHRIALAWAGSLGASGVVLGAVFIFVGFIAFSIVMAVFQVSNSLKIG